MDVLYIFKNLLVVISRCGQDDGFSPLSWADEVENHEKVVFTERARSKYGGTTRSESLLKDPCTTGQSRNCAHMHKNS